MRRHPVQISFSFLLHVTLTHLGAHIVGSPRTSPRIASVLVSDAALASFPPIPLSQRFSSRGSSS